MTKVLIGCPTCERYEKILDIYISAIKQLNFQDYDILLVDNSKTDEFYKRVKAKRIPIERTEYSENPKKRIVESRNLLLKRAIEGDYDYLLSLEQDIIAQPDLLKKLISAKKEIISAYYGTPTQVILQDNQTKEIIKATLDMPIIWLKDNDKIRRANPNEVINKGIIEVGATGLGCILISKNIFKKIKFRFEENKLAYDDMFFCHDVKKLGYKIYLYSDIQLKHLHNDYPDMK